jgi:nitroreductase
MAEIQLSGITKIFDKKVKAVDNVSFDGAGRHPLVPVPLELVDQVPVQFSTRFVDDERRGALFEMQGMGEEVPPPLRRPRDHPRVRHALPVVDLGEGLERLGEVLCNAALADDSVMSPEAQAAIRKKPQRAPMIVVAIASCQEHPKVPVVEQLISTGAAVQNMLNAAYAQGVGAFWRTGPMAYHPQVKQALGLGEREQIVGFLYLGTPAKMPGERQPLDPDRFFQPWPSH